ncbi:F-box domain-containing protein [Mycena indigotica]|uniref:F-box domain-containing protein n=1 Tax=Mycena indigotica TaxID=2126181 RepID=A0A8H6TFY6_9AGAR|nr:F-box domain-containing protein [Mycena indigotica]KAF7315040.1 F-box domain-containing protein [Mycena indigotica]
MDADALRQFTRRIVRLDQNWGLAQPRIIGQVRKWRIGERSILESNCLFQFPTSEMFIFHSSKLLKCFNCATNQNSTVLDLNAYVRAASFDILPDQSVIMGLALRGGPRFNTSMLVFARLELNSDKTAVTGTVLLRQTLTDESDCEKPFVSATIVGAVRSRDKTTEVLAYNLLNKTSTIIETDIPIDYTISRRLEFSFHEENLYMLADDCTKAYIYCCPRDMLPYDQTSDTSYSICYRALRPLRFANSTWKRRTMVSSQMYRNASFVKVHDVMGPPGSTFGTSFRFWQRADRLGEKDLVQETIVPGVCPGELTLQVGLTGHHVVAALLGPGQSGFTLTLVSSNPEEGSCSSHQLQLPVDWSAPPPNILSVDDYQGVVWLASHGNLLAVPYA